MIPDPNPTILYACISRASIILAHFSSGDRYHRPNLETLAPECLQNVPAFHRIYSYSVQDMIHIFLIEDPFVYFAILLKDDDYRCKSHGIEFLGRLKDSFMALVALHPAIDGADSVAHDCFNDELRPVLQRLIREEEGPNPVAVSDVRSLRRGSSVADAGEGGEENKAKMLLHNVAAVRRELSLSPSPKGGEIDKGRQQARMLWRKHVRLVLLIDLAICCVLLTVWMSICKGFRCVER